MVGPQRLGGNDDLWGGLKYALLSFVRVQSSLHLHLSNIRKVVFDVDLGNNVGVGINGKWISRVIDLDDLDSLHLHFVSTMRVNRPGD